MLTSPGECACLCAVAVVVQLTISVPPDLIPAVVVVVVVVADNQEFHKRSIREAFLGDKILRPTTAFRHASNGFADVPAFDDARRIQGRCMLEVSRADCF